MLAEKQMLLDEVKSKLKPEHGFIVTGYDKMSANAAADFRQALVKNGGDFFSVKKRVLAKAAQEMDLPFELSELEGHIGIAIAGDDSFVSLAKEVFKYQKENKKQFNVLGGHFEGAKCSAEEVKQISMLPSLDEMRAQIVGLFEAPMAQTVGCVSEMLKSIIYCVDNKSKKET